jgi:hypothetical protein
MKVKESDEDTFQPLHWLPTELALLVILLRIGHA